jgi:hypothetical protein
MTLSVADVDRWSAGDVREVFHATSSRARAAAEASNGIAQLPAFDTWGGDASDAAKAAIDGTRKDLDAHGNEALAVALAADRAAGDIEALQGKLADLRERAHQLGMALDAGSNTFVPATTATEEELAPAGIDDELARAINMATGHEPIPYEGRRWGRMV